MTADLHNLLLIKQELSDQKSPDIQSLHKYARQSFALMNKCLSFRPIDGINPQAIARDLAHSLESPEDEPHLSPAQWRADILFSIQLCLHILMVNTGSPTI